MSPFLLLSSFRRFFLAQIRGDFAELFQGGFEILTDFLGQNVGVGKVVRLFEAFVSEPEDVEAGLVADS